MSADAWRICPQCLVEDQKKRIEAMETMEESYGKVSPEEWLKMKADLEKRSHLEETLREDYGIGTDEEGHFYVSYEARCEVCGFQHSFKHEEGLKVVHDPSRLH